MGFEQVLSWLPLWCVFSLPTLTQLLCTPESLVSSSQGIPRRPARLPHTNHITAPPQPWGCW